MKAHISLKKILRAPEQIRCKTNGVSYVTLPLDTRLPLVTMTAISYMTAVSNNDSTINYMILPLVTITKHITFTEGYTHQNKQGAQNTRQTEKPKKHSGQRNSRWGHTGRVRSWQPVLNDIPTCSWQGIVLARPLQYLSFEDSCPMHCTNWLPNCIQPTWLIGSWKQGQVSPRYNELAVKKLQWFKQSSRLFASLVHSVSTVNAVQFIHYERHRTAWEQTRCLQARSQITLSAALPICSELQSDMKRTVRYNALTAVTSGMWHCAPWQVPTFQRIMLLLVSG
jgi:hypothetical protein